LAGWFDSATALDILAVDPVHHYRGAGRMLVGWGTKMADEMGVEVTCFSDFAVRSSEDFY
jgi:predicted N-acetyltransferase YhbS